LTHESEWVDLAAERVGGRAILTNDDFFAPMENLLKPGRGVFIEDKYTDRGKWMDGWESRRRREPGHDWCVVRLGMPGAIHRVNIDTNHFRGNHPGAASIDGCVFEGEPGSETEENLGSLWTPILELSELDGHSENLFDVAGDFRLTHIRLNIFPDGGVARLRVLGEVRPDWDALAEASEAGSPPDLLAVENGGVALASSDEFFSKPINLTMPGRSETMGDGWETRRRRGPGHDWAILRLGHRGVIEQLEVDTNHFKGNYPESCSLEGCDLAGSDAPGDWEGATGIEWSEILPRTKLDAHTQHQFADRIVEAGPFTHVRLSMYPDGGISRLRLHGRPVSE
jgi:allantoicase